MPFVIHRVDGLRRLVVVATGRVTLDEATRDMAAVRTGEVKRYGVLLDLTLAEPQATWEQVRGLVDYLKSLDSIVGPRGPVAIVAPHSREHGIWRQFGMLVEQAAIQQRVAAFRTIESAEEWLDQSLLPPETESTPT